MARAVSNNLSTRALIRSLSRPQLTPSDRKSLLISERFAAVGRYMRRRGTETDARGACFSSFSLHFFSTRRLAIIARSRFPARGLRRARRRGRGNADMAILLNLFHMYVNTVTAYFRASFDVFERLE